MNNNNKEVSKSLTSSSFKIEVSVTTSSSPPPPLLLLPPSTSSNNKRQKIDDDNDIDGKDEPYDLNASLRARVGGKHFKKELIEKHANDRCDIEMVIDDCTNYDERSNLNVSPTLRRKHNSRTLYRHQSIEYIKPGNKTDVSGSVVVSKSINEQEEIIENKSDNEEELSTRNRNTDNLLRDRNDYLDRIDKIEIVNTVNRSSTRTPNRDEINQNSISTDINDESNVMFKIVENNEQNSIARNEINNAKSGDNFDGVNNEERTCKKTQKGNNDDECLSTNNTRRTSNVRIKKTADVNKKGCSLKCVNKQCRLTEGNVRSNSVDSHDKINCVTANNNNNNNILKTRLDYGHETDVNLIKRIAINNDGDDDDVNKNESANRNISELNSRSELNTNRLTNRTVIKNFDDVTDSIRELPLKHVPDTIYIFNMPFKCNDVISSYKHFYKNVTAVTIKDILYRMSKCITFPLIPLWNLQSTCDNVSYMLAHLIDGTVPLLTWDICKRIYEIVEFFKVNYNFVQYSNINNEQLNRFNLPIRVTIIENMIANYTNVYNKNLIKTTEQSVNNNFFNKFEYYFNLRLQQGTDNAYNVIKLNKEMHMFNSQMQLAQDERNKIDHLNYSQNLINGVFNTKQLSSSCVKETSIDNYKSYPDVNNKIIYDRMPNNLQELICTYFSYKYYKNRVTYLTRLPIKDIEMNRPKSTDLIKPIKANNSTYVKQEEVNNIRKRLTPFDNKVEPINIPSFSETFNVDKLLDNKSKLIKVPPTTIGLDSIRTSPKKETITQQINDETFAGSSRIISPNLINSKPNQQPVIITEHVPSPSTQTMSNTSIISTPTTIKETSEPTRRIVNNSPTIKDVIRSNTEQSVNVQTRRTTKSAPLEGRIPKKDVVPSRVRLKRFISEEPNGPTVCEGNASTSNGITFNANRITSRVENAPFVNNLDVRLQNVSKKIYEERTATQLIDCSKNHKQLEACQENPLPNATSAGQFDKDNRMHNNSNKSINDVKTDGTMNAYDYVQHLKYLKNNVPSDFYEYYVFVSHSQIRNGNLPIRFEIFIELHNSGLLSEYFTKFVRYREIKQQQQQHQQTTT